VGSLSDSYGIMILCTGRTGELKSIYSLEPHSVITGIFWYWNLPHFFLHLMPTLAQFFFLFHLCVLSSLCFLFCHPKNIMYPYRYIFLFFSFFPFIKLESTQQIFSPFSVHKSYYSLFLQKSHYAFRCPVALNVLYSLACRRPSLRRTSRNMKDIL